MAKVAVYDASYQDMREVVAQVFNDFPLEVKGKKVLVKPNMLGPFPVERRVTTDPSLVKAVVEELEERGAEIIVGDNPGMRGYGGNEECARRSGILDAAGDHFQNIGVHPASKSIKSRFIDSILISKQVLEADLYISLPKFKTHLVTTITAGVKNSFGMLVGGQKAELHRRARAYGDFGEAVADVYNIRPPDLVIVDGVVAMQGNGPSGGTLYQLGKVVAGRNGVEVDAILSHMIGVAPESIHQLRAAASMGLGEINPQKIEVSGEVAVLEDFKSPSTHPAGGTVRTFLARLLTYFAVTQPVVDKERCELCGECARYCPFGAITLNPFPKIDTKKCICCFCCHEHCPASAMEIARHVRFLRRTLKY
jgi:uncharacterized protein (DUF362 family)/Pyruvate/2-oxoacid:ferredoxin oxidoreductase delta subunit